MPVSGTAVAAGLVSGPKAPLILDVLSLVAPETDWRVSAPHLTVMPPVARGPGFLLGIPAS